MDFTGKRVVITGSGSGIGKKTAEKFLEPGARVMISDINEKFLAQAEKELKAKGEVAGAIADVCNYEAIEALARKAMASLYVLRRLAEEEDSANALLLISSDYATFITGQTLSFSGGYSFVG